MRGLYFLPDMIINSYFFLTSVLMVFLGELSVFHHEKMFLFFRTLMGHEQVSVELDVFLYSSKSGAGKRLKHGGRWDLRTRTGSQPVSLTESRLLSQHHIMSGLWGGVHGNCT